MSQARAQTKVSLTQNATLAAYRIVGITAANTVGYAATGTANLIGVTEDAGSDEGTGAAVSVIIGGTAKVQVNDTITAGGLVGCNMSASSGLGVPIAGAQTVSGASSFRSIGIALESAAATNAVIEVLINPQNTVYVG